LRHIHRFVVLLAAWALFGAPVPAESPAVGGREQLLRDRERHWDAARRFQQQGKWPEAITAGSQVLFIERKLFGKTHANIADTLQWLARLHYERKDFAAAESLCKQSLEITTELHGKDDWRAADTRADLALLRRLAKCKPEELARLDAAKRKMAEAVEQCHRGKPRDAIPLAEGAIETQRGVLGEKYRGRIVDLNNLAKMHYAAGDFGQATKMLRNTMQLAQETLGAKHPDFILCLNNLAELYHATGDYAQATLLLRRAMDISRGTFGRNHPDYIVQVNNLAGLYHSMGDYARAEPLLQQVLEIRKTLLDEEHPDYAASLNNLAGIYYLTGRYRQAEPLFRRAMEIRKKVFGEKHPDYAASLDNLAALYEATSDHDQAETLYHKAFEIRRESLPKRHPDYAASLNNLAAIYKARGQIQKAESLYRQALEIRKEVFGEQHLYYATSLNNLATVYRSTGDFERARPLYRQALEIIRRFLDETFDVLSEQQQLAVTGSMRRTLDGYLSVTGEQGLEEQAYQYVLAWKGLVFIGQRCMRLAAARPELAPLLAELQATASQLARLAFDFDPSRQKARQQEFARVSEEKARLEAELSRRSREFRGNAKPVTPESLKTTLPNGVVLVDFLEYEKSLPQPEEDSPCAPPERHLVAFVVRRDRPVVRVELGPVEPIREAIDTWRRTCGREGTGAGAGKELRRLVWLPLEKYVGGVQTVLISPDGALTRFPLAALPGKEPGSYLIEERAVAVVPVPQALPALLAARDKEQPAKDRTPDAALLVLGDIDYDASSQTPAGSSDRRSAAPGKGVLHFEPLENSRGEMLAVRDSFELAHPDGNVRLLRRGQATEAVFRQQATHYRFLHVTTHGFFAPPQLRSLLGTADTEQKGLGPNAALKKKFTTFHPGLLSGLAMAGANLPSKPGRDDGILTAEEVASLNLGAVDLAVLSACETGLGPVAGGEGVLGLQRAFQVSGARTVVASLWKVSDESTRVLMERFYENLWEKKLPKLEALRLAQLWMLNECPERGVTIEPETPATRKPRRSPYYWGGFVLSGDWR